MPFQIYKSYAPLAIQIQPLPCLITNDFFIIYRVVIFSDQGVVYFTSGGKLLYVTIK